MKRSALWVTVSVIVLATVLSMAVLSSSASNILGDVDQNGRLNSSDVRMMLRYMVGLDSLTAEERLLADCDGNNRVDTMDVRYVLKMAAQEQTPSTVSTTIQTTTTTTTKPSLDDDGYYDDIVRP